MDKKVLGDPIAKRILIYLFKYRYKKFIISSKLAIGIDCTKCSVTKVLIELEKRSFLTKTEIGRIKKIKLTENGEMIAEHLNKINELLR